MAQLYNENEIEDGGLTPTSGSDLHLLFSHIRSNSQNYRHLGNEVGRAGQ